MERFRNLIANMPVNEQAFTSKRETWEKYTSDFPDLVDLINKVFGQNTTVEISRYDLFHLAENKKIREFIFSTILWGYPAGMRGLHFQSILRRLNDIEKKITSCLEEDNIHNWKEHYKTVATIDGLGLSTYTKLLYFLKTRIESLPALILDLRLIDVFRKGIFREFTELKNIRYDNAPDRYPQYLKAMNTAAINYGLNHENIEMFLFEFGANLKIRSSQRN